MTIVAFTVKNLANPIEIQQWLDANNITILWGSYVKDNLFYLIYN